jgi:tRNA modification GTPase
MGEVRLGVLVDLAGEEVDEVLLTRLPEASSWCRLASWTISSHGGLLIEGRLRAALTRAGGRELDREGLVAHAVSTGSLDPISGEALLQLPEARTERGARYLLDIAAGSLSRRLREAWRLAGDGDLTAARAEVLALLDAAPPAIRLLVPRRILIAGRPNAGKSSLFNRLAERERAAVTPAAGTTRDLLEETIEIEGYPVVLLDSAGLRPEGLAADGVEREGMRRARAAATDAVLFLLDHDGPPDPDESEFLSRLLPDSVLIIRSKSDHSAFRIPHSAFLPVSSRTGQGLDDLRQTIRARWLGPPADQEIPAAPFTARLLEEVRRVSIASSIDGFRDALVQCVPRALR